jgi:hypothetical protein
MAETPALYLSLQRRYFLLHRSVCAVSFRRVKTPASSIYSTIEGKIEGIAEK